MLKTTVEKLQAGDSRDDIKTLARSYLIALEKERNTPGRMLDPVSACSIVLLSYIKHVTPPGIVLNQRIYAVFVYLELVVLASSGIRVELGTLEDCSNPIMAKRT